MAFTETFSLFLLHDLPWQPEEHHIQTVFEEMWGHLRAGVLYFMRYEEGQHTVDGILAAQKELLKYAKLAEKVCPLAAPTLRRPCLMSLSTQAPRSKHLFADIQGTCVHDL